MANLTQIPQIALMTYLPSTANIFLNSFLDKEADNSMLEAAREILEETTVRMLDMGPQIQGESL